MKVPLGPSWGSCGPQDPPQRALRPAFGPILRCLLTLRPSPESSQDHFWTDFTASWTYKCRFLVRLCVICYCVFLILFLYFRGPLKSWIF